MYDPGPIATQTSDFINTLSEAAHVLEAGVAYTPFLDSLQAVREIHQTNPRISLFLLDNAFANVDAFEFEQCVKAKAFSPGVHQAFRTLIHRESDLSDLSAVAKSASHSPISVFIGGSEAATDLQVHLGRLKAFEFNIVFAAGSDAGPGYQRLQLSEGQIAWQRSIPVISPPLR